MNENLETILHNSTSPIADMYKQKVFELCTYVQSQAEKERQMASNISIPHDPELEKEMRTKWMKKAGHGLIVVLGYDPLTMDQYVKSLQENAHFKYFHPHIADFNAKERLYNVASSDEQHD